MDQIGFEPRYSSSQLPGKCLKCLAEEQLESCLRQLLVDHCDNEKLKTKYSALLSFLKSPDSKILRDESEKYLAQGKKVKVNFCFKKGKPEYKLKID